MRECNKCGSITDLVPCLCGDWHCKDCIQKDEPNDWPTQEDINGGFNSDNE